MVFSTGGGDSTVLSPDAAFSALGNETRIRILQTLGDADDRLSFSDLRDRVDIRHSGQFHYHLDQLVGHFVDKTVDGYTLRRPGERVVEAILSGVVTDNPIKKPTIIDQECYYCDAPVMITYSGHLSVFCTSCPANYEVPASEIGESADFDGLPDEIGLLRGYELPPAGIEDRSDIELLRAGNAWANLERIASSVEICPQCSAKIDPSLQVCDAHEVDGGTCEQCGNRYAVNQVHDCTSCNYARTTQLGWLLLAETEVLHFFTSHGINPIAPESPMSMRAIVDRYDEDVVSTDPFRGRFTFTIDESTLTLTVDDDLEVIDVTSSPASEPA